MVPILAAIAPELSELVVKAGQRLIDAVWPDKEKQAAERAAAEMELFKLQRDKEIQEDARNTQLAIAQLQVNLAEAQSTSGFRGNWRPYIGWVCGVGLTYDILLRPVVWFFCQNVLGWQHPPVALDTSVLMTLLFGMLGLGAYRTFEKTKGLP